jgi:hypothetical protein
MNHHAIIIGHDGREYDEVRDSYGRFLALLDEDGNVLLHA